MHRKAAKKTVFQLQRMCQSVCVLSLPVSVSNFTTGYRIDVEKWDTDKQRVRNGCTNKLKQSASEINAELLRQYTEIQNVFKEFEVQDVIPTPAQIKEAFNLKTKEEKKRKP